LAVVGGFALKQSDGKPSYSATVSVSFSDNSALFQLADLKSSVVVPLDSIAGYLSSADASSKVSAQAGGSISMTASVQAPKVASPGGPTTLSVSLGGSAADVVHRAVQPAAALVVDRYLGQATALIGAMQAALDAGRAAVQDRIAALDAQLGTLAPNSVLFEAIRSERVARADDLLHIQQQSAVLTQYLANVPKTATSTSSESVSVVAASSRRLMFGVLLGAFGGLAVVALVSLFDRRLRVRKDVVDGDVAFLGALGPQFDDVATSIFVLAVAAHDVVAASSDLTLVCPDELPRLASLVALVEQARAAHGVAGRVTCVTGVARHPDRLVDALGAGGRVIAVAAWGRSDRVAFSVLLRGLSHVSDVEGWLIASVPRRWSARSAS
jgi:hypothetical protein